MRSNDYGEEARHDDDWVNPLSMQGDGAGEAGSVDGDGGAFGTGDFDGGGPSAFANGDGDSRHMSDGDGPGDWLDS